MTPNLQWLDSLTLGLPAIDLDHKAMFLLLRAAIGAAGQNDRVGARQAIRVLTNVADEHFRLEEEMMLSSSYYKLNEHAATHLEARLRLDDMMSSDDALLDVALMDFLHFFFRSILVDDYSFVNHLISMPAA